MTQPNRRERPRRIVVLGDGAVAWAIAGALRRALPDAAVVVIAAAPARAALADRWPYVAPPALQMLAMLGLDEGDMVRRGVAAHVAGYRFDRWGPAPFVVPLGEDRRLLDGVARHLLLRARAPDVPLSALALVDALVDGECFVPGALEVGLRLEPDGVERRLRQTALALGVRRHPASAVAIDRTGSEARVVVCDAGAAVDGDLFVDGSGPGGLLGRELPAAWRDVPCGTLAVSSLPGRASIADHYRAHDWGWEASLPAPWRFDRLAFTAEQLSLREAEPAESEIERLLVRPASLDAPMAGNTVIVGEGAIAPGALGQFGFTLALLQLGVLLELLPGRTPDAAMALEYNRRINLLAAEARTFLSAFTLLAKRPGVFWDAARRADPTPQFEALVALFGLGGRLLARETELIADDGYVATLIGLGQIPRRTDAIARSVPRGRVEAFIANERSRVAAARTLPRYASWLASVSERPHG